MRKYTVSINGVRQETKAASVRVALANALKNAAYLAASTGDTLAFDVKVTLGKKVVPWWEVEPKYRDVRCLGYFEVGTKPEGKAWLSKAEAKNEAARQRVAAGERLPSW